LLDESPRKEGFIHVTKNTRQTRSDSTESMRLRTLELMQQGFDHLQASGRAQLERRIQDWPTAWGNTLHILLYGDFERPEKAMEYPSLGITVYPQEVENVVVGGSGGFSVTVGVTSVVKAHLVLEAEVTVSDRHLEGLIDAIQRINLLLGAITLENWANNAIGWWSLLTHGARLVQLHFKFSPETTERINEQVLRLPPALRQKLDAALYWVREPNNLAQANYRSDVLRVYAAYWNAFECLVEGINILRPVTRVSKTEKQRLIDKFVAEREGRLTGKDIQECYQEIVNPSFVGQATHALRVCFGDQAETYIRECFLRTDRHNRLYDIRNAINHGEIDAEHPEELLRVESRLRKLWFIVWRMFGRLVPFKAPVDTD
jgi:hypothetical protein